MASLAMVRNSDLGNSLLSDVLTVLSFTEFRQWIMLKLLQANSWAYARPMPSVAPVMRAQGALTLLGCW